MIKTFKCKETRKIFDRTVSRKFSRHIQTVAMRKLWMIHASVTINDLRIPPANHLEKLSCVRKGQFSIRINKKYRICFLWQQGHAYEVEIIDYPALHLEIITYLIGHNPYLDIFSLSGFQIIGGCVLTSSRFCKF